MEYSTREQEQLKAYNDAFTTALGEGLSPLEATKKVAHLAPEKEKHEMTASAYSNSPTRSLNQGQDRIFGLKDGKRAMINSYITSFHEVVSLAYTGFIAPYLPELFEFKAGESKGKKAGEVKGVGFDTARSAWEFKASESESYKSKCSIRLTKGETSTGQNPPYPMDVQVKAEKIRELFRPVVEACTPVKKTEETKVEETKVEETKVEETKVEETKIKGKGKGK